MKFLILLINLLFLTINLSGTVRYVSKTGSSTPPYTTWLTAADSIQKAIDFSVFGDTIYVANGVYADTVRMIRGLTLIGSGMDSCIIDTRSLVQPTDFYAIVIEDSCVIRGFRIIVSDQQYGLGIMNFTDSTLEHKTFRVEYNKIMNSAIGILTSITYSKIRKNIFENCYRGVYLRGIIEIDHPQIDTNYFSVSSKGVMVELSVNPVVRGNIIMVTGEFGAGFLGGYNPILNIYNNLIISQNEDCWYGIEPSVWPAYVYNNVVINNFSQFSIRGLNGNILKNNVAVNGHVGILWEDGQNPVIQYNNSWNNNTNYKNFTPDSTNISVDPMFVDEENMDFHLQMFSPLIDAGDPNILDKDGSRSDIGLYGGPYGESYTYQDLAPKPPKNLTAEHDSNIVTLNWFPNTEADFYKYRVYRDTIPNFIYDTTKIIAVIDTNSYWEYLPFKTDIYYKITAIDSQMNQSPPSEEVVVLFTGVDGPKLIANDYRLYPPYPNPFNPGTTISYRLKEGGRVRLVVYDIKGSIITELVNEYQPAGYYETYFDAGKLRLASGVYLFRIEVIGKGNVPVYQDMTRSILVK